MHKTKLGRYTDEMEDVRRERRRRQRQKCINCIKKMAAFLFSHIGLAAMVVAYSIMGGFLFKALEAPFEIRQKVKISSWKEDQIVEIHKYAMLLNSTINNVTFNKYNFTEQIRRILLEFQGKVTTAVKDNGWDGRDSMDEATLQWSFAGALLYAVTVITTIGYGHVAPKTPWGRLVTIVYALVGIPLTFLYLSNIGNFLADCFRMFYKKICCDLCCCQKCERKKKRERLRLRRRRELAAQRNSVLKATSASRFESSPEALLMIEDTSSAEDVMVYPGQGEGGMEGGHDNYTAEDDDMKEISRPKTVEEGCLGGCPPSPRGQGEDNWEDLPDDLPDDLRETDILGDDDDDIKETAILDDDIDEEGNEIKETAILDSDTGDEGDHRKSDPAHLKALSDPDRRDSLFNKLDDAKETDILDDSDDEVFVTGPDDTPRPEPEVTEVKSDVEEQKEASVSDDPRTPETSKVDEKPEKPKKGTLKKDKKKDRGRSSDKEKRGGHSTSPSKEKDNLSPSRSSKDKTKGKHKPSKKLKRKDTKKTKKKESNKAKKQNAKSTRTTSDSADETMNIVEADEERSSTPKPPHGSEESFVTARAESVSLVGIDDVENVNDAYQADATMHQPEKGIVTIATEDGVVKYDPDSVAIDVGTDSPYDVELLDYPNMAKDGPPLGFVEDVFDYDDEDEDGKVTVPISICLIIIAGYIFGGSVLFTLWEEWDYLTGSYFCFITLSTIGFGDIVPGTDMEEWASHEKLVLCALWLAFGLSLLAMCFNLMQEEVKEKCKWVGQKLGLLRDEAEG